MSDNGSERLRRAVAMEIRVLMLRRGVRAVSIAQRMGKSEAYMSRRLNGDTALDLDDLEAIAAALDVPITDLFPRGGGNVSVSSEAAGVTVSGRTPWSEHPVVAGAMPISPLTRPGGPPPSPTRTYPTGR